MVEGPLGRAVGPRIPGPVDGWWRVAKWPEPLAFPPRPEPLPDADLDRDGPPSPRPIHTGNRWDDADAARSALYCASTAEGAFGEVLARFRERPQAWALLAALSGPPDVDEPEIDRGTVPPDWPHKRNVAFAAVEPDVVFVDVDASDAHVEIARELPWLLRKYGLRDIDRGVVLGPDRRVTRHIAAYYGQQAERDVALAGLRYESRVRGEWECWVVWAPAPVRDRTVSVLPLTWTNRDLRSAAAKLRLALPSGA